MADHEQLLTLASDIVSAHVSSDVVTLDQLPALIQQVFNTLATVEQRTADAAEAGPSRPSQAIGEVRPHRLPGLRQTVLDD